MEACQEEAPTDTPFVLHELRNAIPQGRDTSPGVDQVTYSMLSRLGDVGAGSLLHLCNASLQAGALPASWKEAVITPITKLGEPGAMGTIYLLSCVGKGTERLILGRLRWQAGEFHPHLFAFQHRRNTTSCLMTLLHALRQRSGLVVFLDLEKAFELANPIAMLETLVTKGIRGRLLKWVRDFLTARTARVRFQGRLSSAHRHTMGTPQGSCISPFIFNTLVERLLETSYGHSSLLLAYADDLALFLPRANFQEQAHQAVSLLHQRCVTLGLKVNPEKTRYMTFGLSPLTRPLALDGTPVSRTIRHKYLGVFFDPGLTFKHQVRYIRARAEARHRVLRFLFGNGPTRAGASQQVLRTFYVMGVRSILRSILGAPRWTSAATMREECSLPTIKARIQARICCAMVAFQRCWPNSRLTQAFQHAFNRPPADRPDRDWVHAAADAARFLGVGDVVRCGPDLPITDHPLPPPWSPPPFSVTTFTGSRPKQLLPAILRQEALRLVATCTSPTARHYFTDGSVSGGGAAGSAFICGGVSVGRRLPRYATAFQAELAAILLTLSHAHDTRGENGEEIHIFSDSASALQALQQARHKDNLELLSALHHQMAHFHRDGANIHLHWIPGHVGVTGNERADTAARLAGAEEELTLEFPRSSRSLKTTFHTAAHNKTKEIFESALETGSASARFYSQATHRRPAVLSSFSPTVARSIQRLRLGYLCRAHILDTLPDTCDHCLTVSNHPLLHYVLQCPETSNLRRGPYDPHIPGLEAAARTIHSTAVFTLAAVVRQYPPPQ